MEVAGTVLVGSQRDGCGAMESAGDAWAGGDEVSGAAKRLEQWEWSAEQTAGEGGQDDAPHWYEEGGDAEYAVEAEVPPLERADYYDYAVAEGSYFALDATYETIEGAEADAVVVSPFDEELYWQQYGEDVSAEHTLEMAPLIKESFAVQPAVPVESNDRLRVDPPQDDSSLITPSSPTSSPGRKREKKAKAKQERIEMRQELLEKEEAEMQLLQKPAESHSPVSPDTRKALGSKTIGGRPTTFLERERTKLRLQMRRMRAIGRKRIPPQVRILTQTRQHLSPLEIYFGRSVESALSDIFWASMKGDLPRVRFLVEVECVSVVDSQWDPWSMEQSPLHWAAKGGHAPVIEYLIQHGANPRAIDETGSLPLHLACWAGHIDAAVALLRATDTKDLYVQDYDAALAPLDWAHLRGHEKLVKAIEKFEDSLWLPKFVDDLIRGIIRYKIKLFKEQPRIQSPTRGIGFLRGGPPKTTEASGPNETPHNQIDTEQKDPR